MLDVGAAADKVGVGSPIDGFGVGNGSWPASVAGSLAGSISGSLTSSPARSFAGEDGLFGLSPSARPPCKEGTVSEARGYAVHAWAEYQQVLAKWEAGADAARRAEQSAAPGAADAGTRIPALSISMISAHVQDDDDDGGAERDEW